MTEEEKWFSCIDPQQMLQQIGGQASDRKLRLFAVACARLAWPWLGEVRSRHQVQTAERMADGQPEDAEQAIVVAREVEQLEEAVRAGMPRTWMYDNDPRPLQGLAGCCVVPDARDAAEGVIAAFGWCPWVQYFDPDAADPFHLVGEGYENRDPATSMQARQCRLLREIFGDPFHSIDVNPAWLTRSVVGMAQGIYADRAFDRTPILGDALEDAGCGEASILAHCRGSDPHVLGCWVIDLLLGKE